MKNPQRATPGVRRVHVSTLSDESYTLRKDGHRFFMTFDEDLDMVDATGSNNWMIKFGYYW